MQTVNGTGEILVWVFSPFCLSVSVHVWHFPRNLPVRPSHRPPWSLSAKLKHHHSGLLRSLKPCNSHWRKASRHRCLLQLARKIVPSHSQSRQRLPLLHTTMEKSSKHPWDPWTAAFWVQSCWQPLVFSASDTGRTRLFWRLLVHLASHRENVADRSHLQAAEPAFKGNILVGSLQERPKPHSIHQGSAISQMMPCPLECIGTGHCPEALSFATSATKESCFFHFCFWLPD